MSSELTESAMRTSFFLPYIMALPWYYLERPTRQILLRCYYATCAFSYPVFAGLNWKSYVPSKVEVLGGKSLREEILNPLNIKK